MKIGIIGASFSGLVAGEKLAQAGHDVTVIEKNRVLGGRLASYRKNGSYIDYGLPFITADGNKFKEFISTLVNKDVLYCWAEHFPLFDGSQVHTINPNRPKNEYFASRKGLHAIAHHLKRWVDVKSDEQAGGLTYIGADRSKKRAWMINLTDISVFECDAVILATPAPQAYGLLQTAQDETPVRRIIRVVDDIQYEPRFTLMATYKEEVPPWKGIECDESEVSWIGNESSKNEGSQTAQLAIHSSAAFVRKHYGKEDEEISRLLLKRAAAIAEPWMTHPEETELHFWKYYRPINPIEEYFMELEMEGAPLALIGDYFNGNMAEDAYLSGLYLANYWIDKYETLAVESA